MKRRIAAFSINQSPKNIFARLTYMVRNRGIWYVLKKCFYQFVFRHIHPLVKEKHFTYKGKSLSYCNSKYNNSHGNERTIEVPIALSELRDVKNGKILEVGNVLSHYIDCDWTVVDKYEKSGKSLNQDIIDFLPDSKFDVIISLSTIEHIGWDEYPQTPEKVLRAINHMVDLLKADGRLVVTFPLNWNPVLDSHLRDGTLPFHQIVIFKRTSWKNMWVQVSHNSKVSNSIGTYIGADFVAICEYNKSAGFVEKPN